VRLGRENQRKSVVDAISVQPRGPLTVPAVLFAQDGHSAGKAVWDHLRIRKTVYGHRYQYGVTGGQQLPNGQAYIPRKATPNGFRTRSLRVIGSSDFQTSTIKASGSSRSGFRTLSPSNSISSWR